MADAKKRAEGEDTDTLKKINAAYALRRSPSLSRDFSPRLSG
jgi:hypothetical protein